MRQLLLSLVWLISLMVVPIAAQTEPITTFTGTLNDQKTFYEYPILIPNDDTTIVVEARATSGDLDTIVYLLDSADNIVAQNDNRRRDILDSYLEYHAARAGAYTLILARYNLDTGTTAGDFELTIALSPTATTLPPYDVSPQALASVGYPMGEAHPPTDWTIFVYYGGDNNLEESLIKDLSEFQLGGGSDETVTIIALLDRSAQFSTIDGDWSGTRLYHVTLADGGDAVIQSTLLADLGDLDTGDGLTLAQFLAWGLRHYPAQHYALAFGSHGAGWQGIITDDVSHTIITLTALDHVFQTLRQTFGDALMFDLVINDACLMSSVEYHAVMARYFKMSFASPEIVIDPALDMALFTTRLRQNPQPDGIPSIGELLIDKYLNIDLRQQNMPDWRYMTNAVTDLTRFAAIEKTLNQFADVILSDPLRYSPMLGAARGKTYTYSSFRNGASLIDLGNLMRQVILLSSDETVIVSAQAVLAALREAVVYRVGGSSVAERILYQNIYFPARAKDFENVYFLQSPLTRWGAMLRAYYNALSPRPWKKADLFHPPMLPQVAITNQYPAVPSIINPLRMNMEVIGRNIAQGFFIVDYRLPTGDYERLINLPILVESLDEMGNPTSINQWDSGVSASIFEWDVTVSQLTDGALTRYVNIKVDLESNTASLEGRYRMDETMDWHDVIVIFGVVGQNEDVAMPIRVISRNPDSDALAVVTIPDGAHFQVFQTLVTDDDTERIVPDEAYTFTWNIDTLQLVWEVPAPSGDYRLGFKVVTYGGTDNTTTVPVVVDNEGLDPTLRGYTNTIWGYTFVLDGNWYEPVNYVDLYYEEAYHHDMKKRLRVYKYEVRDEFRIDVMLQNFGLQIIDEQLASIHGADQTLYTYTDGDVIGVGASYYPMLDGDALFIGLELVDGEDDLDLLSQQASTLLAGVTLFDPQALIESDTSVWDVFEIGTLSGLGFGASYSIPKSWRENLAEDGIWLVASPPNTPHVFMRLAQLKAADPDVLLDAIIADRVQTDLTTFAIAERRVYYAQNNTWQVVRYTAVRDDMPVVGRVYATVSDFDLSFVMWQEAPADRAAALFNEIFEPMVDALFINKPYRSYSLSEYGFTLYYPLWFGYFSLMTEDSTDYLIATTAAGITYLVDFFPNTSGYDAILDVWQDFRGYSLVSDPFAITYNGKEGMFLIYQFEDDSANPYAGYGFLTTSTDGKHGIVLQIFWQNPQTNTVETSIEIFTFLMNLNNYGTSPTLPDDVSDSPYQLGQLKISDDDIGLAFVYPDTWSNPTYNQTFGEQRYIFAYSPTGESELSLYVTTLSEGENLFNDLYDFRNVTLTQTETVIVSDNIAASIFDYVWDSSAGRKVGIVVYLQNPAGYTYIFEWVNHRQNLPNIQFFLDEFLDSLLVYPPANETLMITYNLRDLGISVMLPTLWDVLDSDGDLYYSANPEGNTFFYIYVARDVTSIEMALDLVLQVFDMQLTSDLTPITIAGLEALEFELAFGNQVGIGAGLMIADDIALIFTIEGVIPAIQPDWYRRIILEGVQILDD